MISRGLCSLGDHGSSVGRLINCHSARRLGLDVLHVDRVDIGLLLNLALSRQGLEVWLEALSKVAHAYNGVGDGEQDKKNSDDGKSGKRSADSIVSFLVTGLVDSDQLEEEITETAKIENDDTHHARLVLPAGEIGGGEQNGDGDGNGDNCQSKFRVVLLCDNDDKLNDETEEEEEIELEQSNVNLVVEEALLHAVISTNVLENVPSVFLVDLPGDKDHANGREGDNGRDGNQVRLDIAPEVSSSGVLLEGIVLPKNIECLLNLVNLNGSVDHESQVGEADSDNLDSVLLAEGIPDDNESVEEAENEEG